MGGVANLDTKLNDSGGDFYTMPVYVWQYQRMIFQYQESATLSHLSSALARLLSWCRAVREP